MPAMPLTPHLRKAALTTHITVSVGWLGAVVAFLALSLVGVTSQHAETVRSVYLCMDLLGRFVIVPASLLALASGLLQSLGTEWGVFRYTWVVVKLVVTIGAVLLLVLHQFVGVADAARRVSETTPGVLPDIGRLGPQLVKDAALATVALAGLTTISVFKPWGRTAFGRARQSAEASDRSTSVPASATRPRKLAVSSRRVGLVLAIAALAALLIGLNYSGHLSHRQ